MSEYFGGDPVMLIPATIFAVALGVLLGLLGETLTRKDK